MIRLRVYNKGYPLRVFDTTDPTEPDTHPVKVYVLAIGRWWTFGFIKWGVLE